jgi:hypothetical protein
MSDDLHRLAADLEIAGPRAQREAYSALRFEGQAMKQEWRGIVSGARGLPGLAGAVSYDVTAKGLRSLELEVGYDQRGQGELGNIAEFGTSTQGPKRPAGERVLKGGVDRLEKFLASLDPL